MNKSGIYGLWSHFITMGWRKLGNEREKAFKIVMMTYFPFSSFAFVSPKNKRRKHFVESFAMNIH